MSITSGWRVCACLAVSVVALAEPARAQYRRPAQSTGETYHIEAAAGYWNPSPEIAIARERLGIAGSNIDLVNDLGGDKTRVPALALVLRPARKHKVRLDYTPISYDAASVLPRDVTFDGVSYPAGTTVDSTLELKTLRFGYEYDFVANGRGFLGVIAELNHTKVTLNLRTPVRDESADASATMPTFGGVGRVYLTSNVSMTFEMTGLKLPEGLSDDRTVTYVRYDLYGTADFNRHIGVRLGYRSLDVTYIVSRDSGDVNLKGLYFGLVARF